jgi:antitoxin component YwqK of YwqJK toxin-antitoxin module
MGLLPGQPFVGEYRNDHKHGTWKRWVIVDCVVTELHIERYRRGKHGKWQILRSDGVVMRELHYRRDLPHGRFFVRHSNGRIKQTGAYRRGVPIGQWRAWSAEGDLLYVRRNYNKRSVHERWKNGRLTGIGLSHKSEHGDYRLSLEDDLKLFEHASYPGIFGIFPCVAESVAPEPEALVCPRGTVEVDYKLHDREVRTCERANKQRHGPYQEVCNDNGKLMRAGRFVDGHEHGRWRVWHYNGAGPSRERYQRGKLVESKPGF